MNARGQIHQHPLLAEVFELLHRMELSKTKEPLQWMARDAIRKLEEFEKSSQYVPDLPEWSK